MTRRKNRNALRLLSLAAVAGLGMYHNTTADDTVAGGGGGDKKVDDKKADKKPDQPKKIELTEEELAKRVADALAEERRKHDDEARAKQEEADRKKAEEQGEYKTLLSKADDKNAALAGEVRSLKLERDLSRHLADKHPDHVKAVKWILPTIPADAKEGEWDKAIEKAASEFVAENQKTAKGAVGAPPRAPVTGGRGTGTKPIIGNQPVRQPSVAASRF